MTNSIRFYWNGIRLNGEKKLVKCSYSMGKDSVSIYAHEYGVALPRDLFDVKNESDSYTDYFDTDSAVLNADHPLYKYARYAAAKAELRYLPKHIEYLESNSYRSDVEIEAKKARKAELEAIENPGHPTAEDLEAIARERQESENARKAAEHEAQLKERERVLACKSAGRIFIEETAAKYPIREGEPVVTINWSEHPAFYSWEDGELKLSVAAAEIVLKHYDEAVSAEGDHGYDKTSFTITYVNDRGERGTYEGRYDLGDNDGGLIEHIRSFGRYYAEKGQFGNWNVSDEDRELGKEIMAFADMLEGYTAGGRIINVVLAPWVEEAIRNREQEDMKDMAMVMYLLSKMTDQEIADMVMKIDPKDPEKADSAQFFIQHLAVRNLNYSIRVYQEWKKKWRN